MKHSVAPQLRKAISLAFFCAVCNVMGIRIALRFGRNTSLLIARAKANLLRRGKNPGGTLVSSTRPPLCLDFPALPFSNSKGLRCCLSSEIGVASSLGLRSEGQLVRLLLLLVIQRFFLGNDAGYARVLYKGGIILCVFLRLLGSRFGVVRGSCTICQSP